jgi:hypothetical protein
MSAAASRARNPDGTVPKSPFTPYVAGIDIEAQQEALAMNPVQDKVQILEPQSESTSFCVNFGTTIISLFSAFLLIIGVTMLAFSIWAIAKKQTTTTHYFIAVSVILLVIGLIVSFRNLCFKSGHIASFILVSLLIAATLFLAIYFTFWPAKVSRFIGKYDQTALERKGIDHFVLDTSSDGNRFIKRHITQPATNPSTNPSTNPTPPDTTTSPADSGTETANPPPTSEAAQPDTDVTKPPESTTPEDEGVTISFTLKRRNIGQMMFDNHVVLSTLCWLGVVVQIAALGYLIHSFHALHKRQVIKRVASVS